MPVVTNKKRNIVNYLVAVVIVLLLINILVENRRKPPKEKAAGELSVSQVEDVFFKVLDEYGIEGSWITKKKYKPTEDDSIKTEYFVKLPLDLPVPMIIKEMNSIIQKEITAFVSVEKIKYGTTEIRIYTNESLKLKATLIPDNQNVRNRKELAFIISNALELGESDFRKFLSVYFPISALVIPNKANILKTDSLLKYSKEYALLISNDISDPETKLNPDYKKDLLRGSVENILTYFRNAGSVLIDERSKLFKSPLYGPVYDDFKHRGFVLHPLKEIISLDSKESPELYYKFNISCSDTAGSRQTIFILSFENFEKIFDGIEKMKKKGNRIIPLSRTFICKR
jgi:hypothetical protein